jgi:hypothetical protein
MTEHDRSLSGSDRLGALVGFCVTRVGSGCLGLLVTDPFVAYADAWRAAAGERCRTGVNEPETEPRPYLLPTSRSSRVLLCSAVTERRQRFVLRAVSDLAI